MGRRLMIVDCLNEIPLPGATRVSGGFNQQAAINK
jgi:hypothetical protein